MKKGRINREEQRLQNSTRFAPVLRALFLVAKSPRLRSSLSDSNLIPADLITLTSRHPAPGLTSYSPASFTPPH